MTGLSSSKITKQNIIDAFWRLYAESGISNVSVTKVCKLAGYNRSTFYAYFKDIYDVLETIESNLITPEDFKEHLLIPLMHCQDDALLLKEVLHFFEIHSPYLPILLGEYGDPHFRHKLMQSFIPVVHDLLPHHAYSEQQLLYIMEYQNAAVLSTIAKWYQNKKDIPEEQLISLLLTLTRHGIRNTLFYPISN